MQNEHSVSGTHVGPDEAAIIASDDGQLRVCMPEYGDDEEVPFHVMLLTAVWLKMREDEAWANQLIEEVFADE